MAEFFDRQPGAPLDAAQFFLRRSNIPELFGFLVQNRNEIGHTIRLQPE